MKEVKCGWQAWLTLTVMLVVPSEALKSGNCESIILCVQIVVSTTSRVPSSCLFPVALWTKIRKSQLFPLSNIRPSSSDRLMLWSSECVESPTVTFVPGNANHRDEHLIEK